MKLFVVAILAMLATAAADCPYSGYVPGSPGVVVDKSFHPKEQPGAWEQLNEIWYKLEWKMEEGVRQGQRVFNHRLTYTVFNETSEYKEWREENPYTPCDLTEGVSLDPYDNIEWPNGSLEYEPGSEKPDMTIDLGFGTVEADRLLLAIVKLMIG